MSDDPKDTVVRRDSSNNNRLKGMRMRDEFMCPITYALMREPTVASDGHTYEKVSIEKWLRNSNKSPRTGEPMETTLIPNLNLKKLIHDIVQEGGAGFYTKDINDQNRLLEVMKEKLLVLECLGPPESDWNMQSFEVGSNGVIGGRRNNLDEGNQQRDVMLFRDIMVSRRHFEITQSPDVNSSTGFSYCIRDLGSAGGTYIRISAGKRKQLQPGMIILLGKHQFTVSSIDDNLPLTAQEEEQNNNNNNNSSNNNINSSNSSTNNIVARKSAIASDMWRLVADAERLVDGLASNNGTGEGTSEEEAMLSAKLHNLRLELDHLRHDKALLQHENNNNHLALDCKADEKEGAAHMAATLPLKTSAHHNNNNNFGFSAEDIAQSDDKAHHIHHDDDHNNSNNNGVDTTMLDDQHHISNNNNDRKQVSNNANTNSAVNNTNHNHNQTLHRPASFRQRRCVLTCCAPDGSPLQGKAFTVTTQGGTLGRKQSNTIATLVKLKDPNTGEEKFASVDSAISSEHARIDFESSDGNFYICDGVSPGKSSTNGTWYRLSGPQQESPTHPLVAGMEVLIGNIRFLCKETMTIAERKLEDQK